MDIVTDPGPVRNSSNTKNPCMRRRLSSVRLQKDFGYDGEKRPFLAENEKEAVE
jgi:hypothetical protein